jgi:hypothetical protein
MASIAEIFACQGVLFTRHYKVTSVVGQMIPASFSLVIKELSFYPKAIGERLLAREFEISGITP